MPVSRWEAHNDLLHSPSSPSWLHPFALLGCHLWPHAPGTKAPSGHHTSGGLEPCCWRTPTGHLSRAERSGAKGRRTGGNREREARGEDGRETRHTGKECRQTDRKNHTDRQGEREQGNKGRGVRRGGGLTEGECQLNTSQLLFCFKDRQ